MTSSTNDLLIGYERLRYRVYADLGNGMVLIHKGSNRQRAVEVANFWDERVNVEFHDRDALPFDERLRDRIEYMARSAIFKLYGGRRR